MLHSRIDLHPAHRIAPVDPRIFGGFAEHLGRCIYDGLFDAQTFQPRPAVLDALRPLGFTVMRYPGGNFASGYHWQDGVGPREHRPTVRELAWQSTEPNAVGTHEFLDLCHAMHWQPMLAVNLGTGSPEEALHWAQYCNSPAGTHFADQRVANGRAEPFHVPLWCLGNEMDGPWQLGYAPAEHYAARARMAAKMIKDAHPDTQLVACGSSGPGMPTYPAWDRTVLETLGDLADYLSLHYYAGNFKDDTPAYLAEPLRVERYIDQADAVCRAAQAHTRSAKRAYLAVDEWNVWYRTRQGQDGRGRFAPPLLEEQYNLEDALVVAGMLMAFIRRADCVKIANLAQVVNAIAPVLTRGEQTLLQTIYHPFRMISQRRAGVALRPALAGPAYDLSTGESAPLLDAAAILDEPAGLLHVFAVNRSLDAEHTVTVALAGRTLGPAASAELLSDPAADPTAANTFDAPNRLHPADFTTTPASPDPAAAALTLPPLSFAAVTLPVG